ncbi:ester cyclase [Iamia majanohamensis]|uniref:Ester cyclase n=1 Tax=Iamia majanohamensis TaxID=467976 RepID=A0AAE9YBH0_9ACTN|nr:ester cyclase [Iamia majanohamensis]WCO68053.1 ester cyclase [Iamia majanohamensis]
MSTASVIEQHISAFNERREEDEPWAADAHMVAPGGAGPTGRDEVLAFLRVFHTAFSDGTLTARTVLADGARGAVEGEFSGTHDGPLASPAGEVPPTGRAVTFRWAAIYEVDGSELRSEHLFFDQADFLAQLGLA